LRTVYSSDLAMLLAGTYADFTTPIPLTSDGFFTSGWAVIPPIALAAEEVYVGFVLVAPVEMETLILGSPQVRLR
jgi:hypothetical protein